MSGRLEEGKMKKLSLLLLVMTLLISACGSDDAEKAEATAKAKTEAEAKAKADADAKAKAEASANPTSTTFESFKKNVVDKKFAATQGYFETYYLGTCNVSQDTFLVIFNYSSTSCSQSGQRTYSNADNVLHEYGSTVSAIESKLIEIINAASTSSGSYKQIATNHYQFASGDYIYGIDLAYPSAANPVYRKNIKSGEYYFLYDVKSDKLF